MIRPRLAGFEVTGDMGGNGSGKSTTLKTVAGVLQPTRGRIVFDGHDISRDTVHQRQQRGIGYLMQGGRVFPNLTVAENFSLAISHANRCKAQAPTVLGSIFPELAERAASRAGVLSGGQRQMLAIEMVFAQEPKIALLDEPTGAIALVLARQVLQGVVQYSKKHQAAILLVEQNVAEAIPVSDGVFRLTEGQLEREFI